MRYDPERTRPGRRFLACVLAAVACLAEPPASEDDWLRPLGPPPRDKPRRIQGGESFPPLPLPVTPLRRSERKREPSPPKLVGKVVWGADATFTWDDGRETTVSDWNQCPGDVQALVRKAGRALGIRYGWQTVDLADFHYDPERLPLLLLSGSRRCTLTDEQARRLRGYLERGGTLLCDSVAGSPWFYRSCVEQAGRILPERRLRRLPVDHPLLRMFFDCREVGYNVDGIAEQEGRPQLDVAYIGSRPALLVSPYGLGCGWDGHGIELIEQALYYDVPSASRLGINLVALVLGYAEAARREARPEFFGANDAEAPTDALVFAQLRHEGHWNVHPGAATNLLARARRDLSLAVSLRREAVDPAREDLAPYPLLFLDGLDDFHLDDAAVARLRSFFARAGTLVVNNGLGLATFDTAVRRELARVLPDRELVELPPEHPVFAAVFDIEAVDFSPAQRLREPERAGPRLLAIVIDGDARVIYSPLDLVAGWQGCAHPQAYAYAEADAVRLGLNVLFYAATH